jgi:hypothetical protein
MNSLDGARSTVRQSHRLSVTALYMSMSATRNEEMKVEDDLAKGMAGF